jgi:hypothetical protein
MSALAAALILLVLGVLGFVPGVTADFQALAFSGHRSKAMLLGVFQVSVLHNLLHLLTGLVGLIMARLPLRSRTFLIGAGVAYLSLWVFGVWVPQDSDVNVLPLNSADNWLHLTFGLGMISLAVAFAREATPDRTSEGSDTSEGA